MKLCIDVEASFCCMSRYIMGVTCILILVFFKFFARIWKPWRWASSFGPLFVCIIGIATVYIGQVRTCRPNLV